MRFFILNWFGQMNPSELLNNHLKYSDFGFEFAERFEFSCIPCIIRIRKFSFHVLSEYGNFHSAYYQYTYNFLKWKIHSAYCQYKLNFVPRILTIR
jgi:hypothetical protein